jgi:glutathione S-transferase
MLKIYGADLSSPSNKIRFTANYLNIPYEYTRVSLRDGEHRKEWFLKLTPVGKIPVIDDDGFVLFESGAIIKYLAGKNNSDLYPADVKRRALIDQWMDFSILHVGNALSQVTYNRIFVSFAGGMADVKAVEQNLAFLVRFLPVLDQQLGNHQYLAGKELSLADLSLVAALDPAEASQIDLSGYKNIVRFRREMMEKEFYKKCHQSYGEQLEKFMARK